MIGTSFSYLPSQETFGEIRTEREVSDKENGAGKQKRRMVTYDMSKMSAALSESAQGQRSDKEERDNSIHKRRKKDKRSSPKKGSPLTSKRRAMRTKKQKDKKRRKSSSTSSTSSSKDSSRSTSSFDSEDHPPENPTSRSKKGNYNPYCNHWIEKIEKYPGIADGSIDTLLELMK